MTSKRAVLRELSWRKCKGENEYDLDALLFFCRQYAKIQHPEHGSIAFELRPAQEEILDTWIRERYSIVLKARQIGWSTLAAVFSLWLCLFYPDRVIVMLSKGEREAADLLSKAIYAYERLPAWMRARAPKRTSRAQKRLSFSNGSGIDSLPSKENPARGKAVTLVIVDEWAFLENPEEAWASIEPIADVGGRVIGLSTANGAGNFFHDFWLKAELHESNFKPMFYPWWANTDRDESWYEDRKSNMLDWQLHQEYPSNPEEAFIKSGNPVFDLDALDLMGTSEPTRGSFSLVGQREVTFHQHEDGALQVWRAPEFGKKYVLGADTAVGLEHGDYSCAYVLSIEPFETVATYHARIPPDDFAEELFAMATWYGQCLLGVEANASGLSTLNQLQRMKYPRLYYRRDLDKRTRIAREQVGWYTSAATKPVMVDDLGAAIRENLNITDALAVKECKTYVRDERGRTNGSPFDDRVMALAVAVQMAQYSSPTLRQSAEEQPYYWTMQYFFDKVAAGAENEPLRMGVFNVRKQP